MSRVCVYCRTNETKKPMKNLSLASLSIAFCFALKLGAYGQSNLPFTAKTDSIISRLTDELQIAQEWHDTLGILKINRSILEEYVKQARFLEAADIFNTTNIIAGKSNQIACKVEGILIRNHFYNRLGYTHGMEAGIEKAFEIIQQHAGKIDSITIARLYVQAAHVKQNDKAFNLALSDYHKALDIFNGTKNTEDRARVQLNIANVYYHLKDTQKVLAHFKAVDTIKQSLPADILILKNILNARILDWMSFDTARIIAQAHQALTISEQEGMMTEMMESNRLLSQLYEKHNRLDHSLKHAKVADSLFQIVYEKQLAVTIDRLDTELKQDAKLKEASSFKDRINSFTIITLSVIVLLVLLLHFSFKMQQTIIFQRKRTESRLSSYTAEIERLLQSEAQLKDLLETKERTITSHNVYFEQKDKLYNEIRVLLCEALENRSMSLEFQVRSITKMLDNVTNLDKDWGDFKLTQENVSSDFFRNIKKAYPTLTTSELKLCGLLKMNVNLKEAARIMGVAVDSVKTARYRLRRKFGLDREANLAEFIIKFDSFSDLNPDELMTFNNSEFLPDDVNE